MEYQETIDLDIENIASTNEKIWVSIYEFIRDDYFKVIKFFPNKFLNRCKNNPNKPQNIKNEVKAALKSMAL